MKVNLVLWSIRNYKYYKNIQSKEQYYQSYWTKNIIVKFETPKWELTEISKTIGEYTVFKATAKIESEQTKNMNYLSPVVAWYTPDIQTFGIQNFTGLPGLPLELTAVFEDGKIQYTAISINLNPKEEVNVIRPSGNQMMIEPEYVEHIKKLNADRRRF